MTEGEPEKKPGDYYIDHDVAQVNVQTEFTWAVLFLAFLSALISLFQQISIANSQWLNGFLAAGFVLLDAGMVYSVMRFFALAGASRIWQLYKLNEYHMPPKKKKGALWQQAILNDDGTLRKWVNGFFIALFAYPIVTLFVKLIAPN